MNIQSLFLISTVTLISACGTPAQMVHPELGVVPVHNEKYVSERDECLGEYMQAKGETQEAKSREKSVKTTSIISKNAAALMELSDALGSNKEATSYTETCLSKKGWAKYSE